MRRALAVAVSLLALTAAASAPSTAAGSLGAASCAAPTLRFLDVHYMRVELAAPRTKLGLRLRRPAVVRDAVLVDHSNCIDVVLCTVGEQCVQPVQPPPSTRRVRVARLAGIAPRVAVADRRDARVIYVGRAGVACFQRGPALARCLRAASR